jgi:Mg-chelatase subunit ChlI
MVDLPLGATEDRVCGTIDIEKALTGQHNHIFSANRVDGVQ